MYPQGGLPDSLFAQETLGTNHGGDNILMGLTSLSSLSTDLFKLSYPSAWLTVILICAGSSWLQVNLDLLRWQSSVKGKALRVSAMELIRAAIHGWRFTDMSFNSYLSLDKKGLFSWIQRYVCLHQLQEKASLHLATPLFI